MKKKWMAIITILIALILLIPQKSYLDDGGTVIYDAILYDIINYDSMASGWRWWKPNQSS